MRYSRSGSLALSRRPNHDLDPTDKLRQRLGDVVDRLEGMQRAGAGIADFVDAGGDRRLDIFATSGTGIPLPFTPGRNHRVSLATLEIRLFLVKWSSQRATFPLQSERFTEKISFGNHGEITISWMVKPVTGIAAPSTANCGEVLQFCAAAGPPRCPRLCPSRDRDIAARRSAARLRDRTAGRKIAPLQKNKSGGDPCKAKPRSIRFCVRNARPRKFPAWSRWRRPATR